MHPNAARSLCTRLPRFAAALVLAAAGLAPLAASAVPITLPTGLNPGDQYRLAFVTATLHNATSTNIADYNAFVTGVANSVPELAALSTTWTAIASTSAVAARDNTSTNPGVNGAGVRIFLLNNTKLADNNSDLWDGTIDVSLQISQYGSPLSYYLFTGTNTDGTSATGAELGSASVRTGVSSSANGDWISSFVALPSTNTQPLYAISGVLTVVPEPGTAALLAMGLIGLGASRRRI